MSQSHNSFIARAREILNTATVVAFLAAIAAPTIDLFVRPDSARSPLEYEMRSPAPRPMLAADMASLSAFPEQFHAYFNDSYGLRDRLLRWHSLEKLLVFGVSPTVELYAGRKGWVFFAQDRSIDNQRGLLPFSAKELEEWRDGLLLATRRYSEIGARFVYVIVPDKQTVYPEFVPLRYNQVGPTRADLLLAYLRENSVDVDVLDLRPVFAAAKAGDTSDEYLYAQLGTHWSGRGAVVAARAILEHVSEFLPETRVSRFEDYQRDEVQDSGDSWGPRMYVGDVLPQRTFIYTPKRGLKMSVLSETRFGPGRVRVGDHPDGSLPRAVLLHDSFGPSVEHMLGESFSHLVCHWSNTRPLDVIGQEHPDVVIVLLVERTLNSLSAHDIVPPIGNVWKLEFERSMRTLWSPSLVAGSPDLQCMETAQVEALPEGGGPGVLVRTRKPVDKLMLPEFTPPSTGTAVLHVEIDSPGATQLSVYFKQPGDRVFRRKNAYSATLAAGANNVYLPFDHSMATGRLVLSPGELSGEYRLRALEVRGVP